LFFETGVPLSGFPGKGSLAVSDFNGDGSQDLVATNAPATSISVLLGNGNGTFRAPLIFDAGGLTFSLAVGDFNDDHVQDLATAIDLPVQLSGGFSVLLGNGNGTFGMPLHFDLVGGFYGSIAVGDFNLDGIHDLTLGR
jgi:FG-GAP-like repeat